MTNKHRSLAQLFLELEELPEFCDKKLIDVNQKGIFGNAPLNICSTQGDIDAIRLLIASGANVNIRGEYNTTPLHDAIEQNNYDVIKELINSGASLELENGDGLKPRKYAYLIGDKETQRILDDVAKKKP